MSEDTFLLCQIQTAIVGGLIGINNAIMIKDTVPSGTDLNTINTIGIYKLSGNLINSPCNVSWGALFVLPANAGSLPQMLVEVTSTSFNLFARRDKESKWNKINMTAV